MESIVYKGQKVITTELLAQAYETNTGNISKNFNRNKGKFIADKHYFHLTGDELREFKGTGLKDDNLKFAPELYLWTERGANRHCKILDTDKAWEQFDNLEETYFRAKQGQLVGNCDVKYLNGVANYLRIQSTLMRRNGNTPSEIMKMSQAVCQEYSVPLPLNLIRVNPYEQLSLIPQ